MLTKLRSTHPVYFMILAGVTARDFQKCFTLGVKADLTGTVVEGKANVDINGCKDVKPNETGMLFLFYLITLDPSV